MAARPLPDVAYLRECLDYDQETGVFRWLVRPDEHFLSAVVARQWNTKWAGKNAGNSDPRGYLAIGVSYQLFKAHRLAWLLVHGEPVPSVIDHVDGVPGNNRIMNLRAATSSDNMANRRANSHSGTGVKGVSVLGSGRFRAVIRSRGVRLHLGCFDTLAEAVLARREAAERLHGDFARHG